MFEDWIKKFRLGSPHTTPKETVRKSVDEYVRKHKDLNIKNSDEVRQQMYREVLTLLGDYKQELSDKGFNLSFYKIVQDIYIPEFSNISEVYQGPTYFCYKKYLCALYPDDSLHVSKQ